ncbi:MAG: hypothetical protein FJ109_05315 [Deltaproteobacteria bacterium]|nr:hypothetical protein [Deltaproteobacteria bacterium]
MRRTLVASVADSLVALHAALVELKELPGEILETDRILLGGYLATGPGLPENCDGTNAVVWPVAVEVIEKKPQESKWDGIGLPVDATGIVRVLDRFRLRAGRTVGRCRDRFHAAVCLCASPSR